MFNIVTDSLIVNIILFGTGLYILITGSNKFVDAAAFIARKYKVSELIIGLTLVSIGTSLPELATNIYSSINGTSEIAMGNIVGSNIANILLVMSIAAIIMKSIPMKKAMFNRDTVVMLSVYLIFAYFCYEKDAKGMRYLSQLESGFLLLCFISYLFYLIKFGEKEEFEKTDEENTHYKSMPQAIFWLISGIILITFGAKIMVDNVVWMGTKLHIPYTIISSTIIAFGTSLPELAVTLSGVLKKQNNIALGNIIGSCIFNIIFVMGASGIINPVTVDSASIHFLLPYMLGSGFMAVLFLRTSWEIVRWEGILLLLGYLFFIGANIYSVTIG